MLQSRILNSAPGEVSLIPELANNIVDISSREAYKIGRTYRTGYVNNRMQGGSVFLPTLPHSLRRAVDTEGRVATGGEIPILGNTVASNKSMTLSDGTNLNMFQFRMAGHKIILPDVATAEGLGLYATKGGFDLDDKLITNLHYVTDSNNNRSLAAFAWRQPTGPQEFSLLTPHMDEGTFTNLFGSDNMLGDKFKRLAEAVSDNISENKIGQMRTLASAQMNPEELARLSREERIVLYANSLLSGNKKAANMYKGSMDIQGGELEKLIFSLTDVGKDGGGFNFDLGTGTGVNIGLDDMGSFQQRDFINLTQLDARIARRAAQGRGAPLTLTNQEYEAIAQADTVYATQYRNSQFMKLFDANTKLAEDSSFTSEIEDLYKTIYGSESYTQYGTELRSQTQRKLNNTEVAYRGLGRILNDSALGKESKIKALNAATKLNQRNALSGLGAENGLGKYVDTLNWAASSEEQRLAVLSRMDSEGYGGLANNLRSTLMPMFSPEAAIDPSIGGTSILSFGGNLQDMRDSIRLSYAKNGVVLSPGQIDEAVNRSVYSLVGRGDDELRSFSKLYAEANPSIYTAEEARVAFKASKDLHFKAFLELSEGDYAPQLNELINVSTENIRRNMINQTGLLTGQIRGAQILLGHQDEDLLGFDQLVTRSKFNVSAKSDELDVLIKQTIAGFESAREMAVGGELPNDTAALTKIDQLVEKLNRMSSSLSVEGKNAVSPESVREELLTVMGLREGSEASRLYGTSSLPEAAREAQEMIFRFKNQIRDQAIEKNVNSVLNPKIEELFGMIESSIKEEILDSSEVGKVGVIERLLENKNLVKEIQNRASFYGEKDPLYKALVETQLIDQFEVESYGAKFGLQSAEDAIGIVQSSALINTRKVLIDQLQSELDNRRFTKRSP